jgi:two-component system, cell cycle response regulator
MEMSRVLVIDDDSLQFRLLQEHFKNFRVGTHELVWAETYDDGLAKLTTGDFAVCLLDYRLGERDGLQLLREATQAGCRTPIVFLTAESSGDVDIQAMEAGALDYLVKGEISPRSLERSLRYARNMGDTLQALRQLATRDQLTGLLNRREYDRILAEEEERARRFGHPVSLVVVDLDRFKAINDTRGHAAGDAVLREAAHRIAGSIRTVDRCARIGGEEFALVLVQTGREPAMEVARRAIGAVSSGPIETGSGDPLLVTASAGVAEFPSDASNVTELFAAADRALYAAKKAGRNRAVAAWEERKGA